MIPNLQNFGKLCNFFNVDLTYFLDDAAQNRLSKQADNDRKVKRWIIITVLTGIIALIIIAFAVCVGLITFTTNIGNQTVQTTQLSDGGFIVLAILGGILTITETVFIVITIRFKNAKLY